MSLQTAHRTHTCGQLTADDVGTEARLAGWVHRVRDHGGIIFVDLRDHYGITQVVVHPDREFYQQSERWHLEATVAFHGTVVRRDPDTVNERIPTGQVELVAEEMQLLGDIVDLPLPVAVETVCDENVRLKYRFLDLRRGGLHNRIVRRSQITTTVRRLLTDLGFLELQTPILTCSSPEGARDFLVPSRLHAGKFYALPQAPQIFKQLYMMAGFDRYFQIAPCFRDEDARADRSPGEFYQIDIEMAFVDQNDVFAAVEQLFDGLFSEFSDRTVSPTPFPRITYADAMLKYGSDKPDLRIPIEIRDVTEQFRHCDLNAFRSVVERGGLVRALPVAQIADRPRSFFDGMIEYTQSIGGKGLGYIGWTDDGVRSPIAKFLSDEILRDLQQIGGMQAGDVLFFVADKPAAAVRIAGQVRQRLGEELDLIEPDAYRFCWIVDYPMYEQDEQTGAIQFSHNPFSMPQGGMEALNTQSPLEILAYQYDLVCNGLELSSGAIRNHSPEVMLKAFEIGGYPKNEVIARFGGLYRALQYGAPPHGGIAPGLDRIIMLLTDAENIREVTAFPLNQNAADPLLGAPTPATEKQLQELRIRCVHKAQKPN